jgi:phosphoglycerate dehydrogenase-like enzyme
MLLFAASAAMGIAMGARRGATRGFSKSSMKIVVLSMPGEDCVDELRLLPPGATVVSKGANLKEIEEGNPMFSTAECLLVVSGNSQSLSDVMKKMTNLKWIHGVFAGLDHMISSEFSNCSKDRDIVVTNAKGVFSSSLAEWVMGAAFYFNKDIPRLNRNKNDKLYERYTVGELRGKTMGIIGYGDIGRACARLAKAYGMKVIAHRRRPQLSATDPLVEKVYGNEDIGIVMSEADFLVVSAALTPETVKMIGARELAMAKKGQVLINVGRGALIDEVALIEALKKGDRIVGAALDVFEVEPLPKFSPLWELPNVLLSPHNADMTDGFRHASVRFFTENCHSYLDRGMEGLVNVVDPASGY